MKKLTIKRSAVEKKNTYIVPVYVHICFILCKNVSFCQNHQIRIKKFFHFIDF